MMNTMGEESIPSRYRRLAQNDYTKAYKIMEGALDQLRAYLAEKPTDLTRTEMIVIANQGKEIAQAASALEQMAIALDLARVDHFDDKKES